METTVYTKTYVGLVIATVCFAVLVGPALADDEDVVLITNSVRSSQSTGGQTIEDGADGHDGQDGADGEDGQNGQSGQGGSSVVAGKSTASIHIESHVNGKTVVEHHEALVSEGSIATVIEKQTMESSVPETSENHISISSSVHGEDTSSGFQQTLLSTRLMILKYVSLLF